MHRTYDETLIAACRKAHSSNRNKTHNSVACIADLSHQSFSLAVAAALAGLVLSPVMAHADAVGENSASLPRVAQAPSTGNAPPATPRENPPALQVPVNPEEAPKTETPKAPETPAGSNEVPAGTTPGTTAATPPPAWAQGREVATVRVVGTRVIAESTVLLRAQNTRPGAAFAIDLVRQDMRSIDDLGFFASTDFQVTPNVEDPNKVDVAFVVVENRVLAKHTFLGNKLIKTEDLQKVVVTKPGSLLNNKDVEKDYDAIRRLYRTRGYAAFVDLKLSDDGQPVSQTGELTYSIEEARISKIAITGLRKTKESLVRSQIRVRSGDYFDENRIRKDIGRLYDLGFFESPEFKIEQDTDAKEFAVNVTFALKERRTGSLSVGLGFDSRSKLTGFLGVSENNFRGTGQRLNAQFEGGDQRTFEFGYGNPFIGHKNADFSFSVFDRRSFRDPRSVELLVPTATTTFSFQERRRGARASYSLPLDEDKKHTVLLGFRNEKVKLFQEDNVGVITPIALPVNSTGRTSALSLGFLRDARDLKIDPSRGERAQIIAEKAFSLLGGTASFTKLDVDLRKYIPLMAPAKMGEAPKLVLAGRVVIGKAFGNLPAFEQYFIGGSDSVRGYDIDTQFGDNQFYGNLELRYRFQKKFQIVAFADAGKASGGNFSSHNEKTLSSVGLGARLQTPIGPIRLDLGIGRDGAKTHFAIGPTF